MRLAEYRDVNDSNRSTRTVVETGHKRLGYSSVFTKLRLVHISAGFEPAGSVARHTDDMWAVEFDFDGARHGRRFRTESEARDLFTKWNEAH